MRWHPATLALCLVAAALVSGCADGAGAGDGARGDDNEATCAALDEMQHRSRAIEQVDVADPVAFEAELDRAVREYRSELEDLRAVAPDRLGDAIDRMDRAVRRHDFEAALRARQPLDAFHAAECAVATAPTTTAG
jgi:hypothetical protein